MPEELAPGVWLLDLGWPSPLGANVYLVDDGDLTLVDAGLPVNNPSIRRAIRETGYDIGAIDRVLITHYDLDHVGGLNRLTPELEAPVYIGAADIDLLDGTIDPTVFHPKGLFHRGARRLYRLPDTLEYRPVADGDAIGGFTAYHTPGHNPGHTVYLHEDRSAAFLGDLVWEDEGGLTTPIWLDSYDMTTLRASIRAVADRLPAFDLACMGHGDPLRTGGAEALRALAAAC